MFKGEKITMVRGLQVIFEAALYLYSSWNELSCLIHINETINSTMKQEMLPLILVIIPL